MTGEFNPMYSTNNIVRDENWDQCLTTDLEAIESDIEALQTGKADADHTHTGFAPATHSHDGYSETGHTHAQADITGLEADLAGKAAADHVHSEYADSDHTHTGYAATEHTHTGFAAENHEHSGYALTSHTHDLSGKADLVDGKVPTSQLPSFVDDVVDAHIVSGATAFSAGWLSETSGGAALTPASDKVYIIVTSGDYQGKTYRWSGTVYAPIGEDLALGETSSTAYRGDRGKTAYDHSQNADVHVTAAQKTAWDGKAAGDHNHDALYAALSHQHSTTLVTTADEDLDNYTTAGVYSFAAAYAPINRPSGNTNGWLVVLPWSASSVTIKQIWIRHGTINVHDHEVYVRTKTSSGWSTWAKIYTDKNPPTPAEVGAVAKSLQFTADNGGMEKTFYVEDNTNLITELENLSLGFHTVYSQAAVPGNPNATESFRCLLHKASSNIMWVLAFGTSGTVFSNYWNGGTWRGWREFYSDGHMPTPAEIGAISTALQFTNNSGGVKENLTSDVLTAMAGKAPGVYTFYAPAGTEGNPNTGYAFRYLCHKTGDAYGWVLGFSADGSVYSNYINNGTWRGWRTLYQAGTPDLLFTGAKLMVDTDTVTPSKKLSECRNGWILEWSDYDSADGTTNNYNIVQTVIYKRYAGGSWNGQNMMVLVPNYISTDGATQSYALKQFQVYNDKLVGHDTSDSNSNNLDVVLRAVYEF